jgi:peptidoglycan/LPS O-acetylase OafA/YrhL
VRAVDVDRLSRAYEKTTHFSSLDGLRCLSIVPVVWHHATPRQLDGVLGKGPLGVHLFFAISGFLITTLLLRERKASGRISLPGFYLRRALRIFPLYYAVLFAYALRTWFFVADSAQRDHFFVSLPYYATYTTNWFVDFEVPHPVTFGFSWSLATEEQFYLTFPFVIALARGWRLPVLFAVGAFGLDYALEQDALASLVPPAGLGFRMLTSISAPICLGALLAHALFLEPSRRVLLRVLGGRASAPLALGFFAFAVAGDLPLVVIHVAMVALVGAVCVRPDHGLAGVLTLRAPSFVGKVSYGVYLFHVSVITATKAFLPGAPAVVLFLIALPMSVLCAGISYRYFEAPLLALRDRFRSTARDHGVVSPLERHDHLVQGGKA